MPLSSVLYVPAFPENLMSVGKITEQLHCSVTFTPTKCTFQELRTNRLIGTAYKDKGLYYMESSPQRVAYLSTSSTTEVHSQLGHPSLQVLKKIRPEFQSISELVCESCIQGKHIRASHPPRVHNRSKSPFALVHSDVWGPCSIESVSSYRYFVTFVHDFSRATWISIIKSRQEIFEKFTIFCSLVQTQFNTTVQTIRSDNA